jgi:hypothetical protein
VSEWGITTDWSYRLSLYRLRTDRIENTACVVEEACLPLGCVAIDVLLLSAIVCCGLICLQSRCLITSYNDVVTTAVCIRRCLATMTFLCCYRNGPYVTISLNYVFWNWQIHFRHRLWGSRSSIFNEPKVFSLEWSGQSIKLTSPLSSAEAKHACNYIYASTFPWSCG